MENTYNYFFSSTPQVLAGIFGLFAVFIIFKINEIKNQINDIKNDYLDILNNHLQHFTVTDENWVREIGKNIIKMEFELIYPEIDNILKFAVNKRISLLEYKTRKLMNLHPKLNNLKKELINKTVISSIITSITIIYCLIMLMLGYYINHCALWSIITFLPAIALSIYIFIKLISIIIYSFKD